MNGDKNYINRQLKISCSKNYQEKLFNKKSDDIAEVKAR